LVNKLGQELLNPQTMKTEFLSGQG